MNTLSRLGIDLPTFLGFLVACLVSWFFADRVIQRLYEKRFDEMIRRNCNPKTTTLDDTREQQKNWRSALDLEFGRRIGRLERIFYIYAFMLGSFSLLSAWVILKAFYGWIQKPRVARMRTDDEAHAEKIKEITTFYMYVYGNALSLMWALVLGHLGKILAAFVRTAY